MHLPLLQVHAHQTTHLLRTILLPGIEIGRGAVLECSGLSPYHKVTNCHFGLYTNYVSPQPLLQTLVLTTHSVRVRLPRGWLVPRGAPEATEQKPAVNSQ